MALDKFTKEEVYKFLNSLVSEGTVVFASAEYEKKFKEIVEENFKPQKGGGATANPPKEIDGIVYHYCRMFQDYLPESEMVFSQGKCKGISRIGQKLSYELNKKADELEKQSVKLFVARKFEEGENLQKEISDFLSSFHLTRIVKKFYFINGIYVIILKNSDNLQESAELIKELFKDKFNYINDRDFEWKLYNIAIWEKLYDMKISPE